MVQTIERSRIGSDPSQRSPIACASMERPVAATLFSLTTDRPDGGTTSWRRVQASRAGLPEAWLQESLFANPELVLAACRAATLLDDEPWHPWCRELAVPGIGSVDVALVSASGRIALVETKLASNPGNRREVVAQLLEYAVHLRETDVDHLPPLPAGGERGEPFPNAADVAHHLADGDFLLLVVGDDLDPRAVRLADNLLGRHLVHPWNLAFVDMALYERVGAPDATAELLCVPHLRGTVVAERRQVVTVRIEGTGRPRVEIVDHEPAVGPAIVSVDAWLQRLGADPGQDWIRHFVARLRTTAEERRGLSIRFGSGNPPTLMLCRNGRALVYVYVDGTVYVNPPMARKAFGEALGEAWLSALRAAIPGAWRDNEGTWCRLPEPLGTHRSDAFVDVLQQHLVRADEPDRT